MKQVLFLLLILITFRSNAQKYVLQDGEYMDTTATNDIACKDYTIYYYQVSGKYLESSTTVLKQAQTYLHRTNKFYEGSGYITFRFRIDCAGHKTKRTQVLQTDENYQDYHFNKKLVKELYLFLNTLSNWKAAKAHDGGALSYIAFITFKIEDGKVINIIP